MPVVHRSDLMRPRKNERAGLLMHVRGEFQASTSASGAHRV